MRPGSRSDHGRLRVLDAQCRGNRKTYSTCPQHDRQVTGPLRPRNGMPADRQWVRKHRGRRIDAGRDGMALGPVGDHQGRESAGQIAHVSEVHAPAIAARRRLANPRTEWCMAGFTRRTKWPEASGQAAEPGIDGNPGTGGEVADRRSGPQDLRHDFMTHHMWKGDECRERVVKIRADESLEHVAPADSRIAGPEDNPVRSRKPRWPQVASPDRKEPGRRHHRRDARGQSSEREGMRPQLEHEGVD